jgi:hypothetical protein
LFFFVFFFFFFFTFYLLILLLLQHPEPIILNGDAVKVSEMRVDGAPEDSAGESDGGGVGGASRRLSSSRR